jgi:hypothetical protein
MLTDCTPVPAAIAPRPAIAHSETAATRAQAVRARSGILFVPTGRETEGGATHTQHCAALSLSLSSVCLRKERTAQGKNRNQRERREACKERKKRREEEKRSKIATLLWSFYFFNRRPLFSSCFSSKSEEKERGRFSSLLKTDRERARRCLLGRTSCDGWSSERGRCGGAEAGNCRSCGGGGGAWLVSRVLLMELWLLC